MRKYFKYFVATVMVLISVFLAKVETNSDDNLLNETENEQLLEVTPVNSVNITPEFYKNNTNLVFIFDQKLTSPSSYLQ